MPKAKIENLMTQLHELFGEASTSEQQDQLFAQLQAHVHDASESDTPDPTPLETVELMLENLGEEHPRANAVLRELLDTLKNIGV